MVYMDNSATSPVDPEVFEEMKPFFVENFGNASTLYEIGRVSQRAVAKARQQVADLINADTREIIFTSGGSESDNFAIKGIALRERSKHPEKNHIITSQIEHPAVLETCRYLEKWGFEVTYLPVGPTGLVDPEDLENAIKDETFLVTIMHANNEIGTIEPIEKLGEIAHKHNVLFHTDAVQSAGKVPIDVKKQNIDLLSISSHKLYGPKGVGALYIRKGVKIDPLIHGGGQERKLRAGTENVAGIVGFGKACEIAQRDMEKNTAKLTEIRDAIIKRVLDEVPESYVNGDLEHRLANNVHLRFSGIEGESLLLRLDAKGIQVATGSACSSQKLEPSHVLTAIGLEPALAHGSLRLSLGVENSIDDVDYVVDSIKEVVDGLRKMSPLWDYTNQKYIEINKEDVY
ncbi:MAG: cysteine desulfurase NifS [Methanobrevibacter boviskoreani]|jgi:cysteine desulfurase|uniref:cysteine desulfurase NifS n=1 Tax=Methanobrevibacter boviskoreani TaxID=1348249 RepID=UPI0023A8233A|nr:cysteine desulfurase NifS [Methanobrevibacter boviskoreani]MCI6930821.1 cysteine desulfurase NifS [Methanobrevibacter boviskoreani]MDD6257476.1 cysteine desulfurase NifS [Methanobrevibacter boviskoreani]